MYICTVIAFAESPLGGTRAWHIHIKRRNWTLWFWRCKNFATSNGLSKTKQRERPLGCLYTARIGLGVNHHGLAGWYIYSSAWGFQRCSFRQSGQCEGLYSVERASDWLHVFCVYVRELTYGVCQSGADWWEEVFNSRILWKSISFSFLPPCWHLYRCLPSPTTMLTK